MKFKGATAQEPQTTSSSIDANKEDEAPRKRDRLAKYTMLDICVDCKRKGRCDNGKAAETLQPSLDATCEDDIDVFGCHLQAPLCKCAWATKRTCSGESGRQRSMNN